MMEEWRIEVGNEKRDNWRSDDGGGGGVCIGATLLWCSGGYRSQSAKMEGMGGVRRIWPVVNAIG